MDSRSDDQKKFPMKKSLRKTVFLKSVASFTLVLFSWNQIVFAAGENLLQGADDPPVATVPAASPAPAPVSVPAPPPQTTLDFLAAGDLPLSPSGGLADASARPEIETNEDGSVTRHVYEGGSVQAAIDQAQAGDTVYLHAGTYHEQVVLKTGVNLKGENAQTTVLDGDYETRTSVIRALGDNRIEDLTVTGLRSPEGQASGALIIEGDRVKVRGNRILRNLGTGVRVDTGAENSLIEKNLFEGNETAIEDVKTGDVVRYNTIAGPGTDPAIRITGIRYVAGRGFQLSVKDTGNLYSYHIEYSDDYGATWKRARAEISAGVFEDQKVLSNGETGALWLDDGSTTEADPLTVTVRWYRMRAAESFIGQNGVEIAAAGVPVIKNNIIVNQRAGAISGAVSGNARIEGNFLEDPGFVDPVHGDYSLPDTSPAYGLGAFLPIGLSAALDRASLFDVGHTIEPVSEEETVTGYRVLYAEGSHEEFYNDGTRVLDTTPPEGTLRINQGDLETDSKTVVLSLETPAPALPPHKMRFSLDNGANWSDWEPYRRSAVLEVPDGEGVKTVRCEIKDAVENTRTLSAAINYTTTPLTPAIVVTSPGTTDQEVYTLTYTVNGEARQETWRLQPGANELLISASNGGEPARVVHSVTLNAAEAVLPAMPEIPPLPEDLVSLTAQNGLVMRYDAGTLVALEQPGQYTLYLPELDASQNILGGLLVFENGDRLLYQDGRPVYLLKTTGEKTAYNTDGTVANVTDPGGEKIRFSYRLDENGKAAAILSFENGITSRYDGACQPVWIKKANGAGIYYEDGLLAGYTDAGGNFFRYETTVEHTGHELLGYRSELVAVKPANLSAELSLEVFLENQANFPEAVSTLNEDLVRAVRYDEGKKITETESGAGEVLKLQNGLPVLFTDAAGASTAIRNEIAANGDLLSVKWAGDGIEQFFDAGGHLSSIRLSDGTALGITESTLERIILSDGSTLTELVWNGQTLTGFRRTAADGSAEIYENSLIKERINVDGSRTTFVNYMGRRDAEDVITGDGKTYRVIRFPDSQGLTQRLMELVKIDMPDGGRIEFEQGKPVRYVQTKQVRLEPYEVPALLEGRFFVPAVEFPDARLRSLTVDENGFIYSGEILFNDGMQYLIENNLVTKQISANGQFVEFSGEQAVVEALPRAEAEPLNEAEAAYRQELLEAQLDYFTAGVGIDADTGLPVDNYIGPSRQPSNYSQATLVGFWAEILSAIAAGDFQTSKMSREEAFQKLEALLLTYQEVQAQAGWKGLVAFFNIVKTEVPVLDPEGSPTGETQKVITYQRAFNEVGFGDVLNLGLSLASVRGALDGLSLDAGLDAFRDRIVASADQILAAQEPGYEFFYDPNKKAFHHVYKFYSSTTGYFPSGAYMDRVFNEFLPGMVWLAARYPQYRDAFYSLDTTLRRYETGGGDILELGAPFDGNAFQMFWPLIHVDETKYPDFEAALRNFLYAQAEFVRDREVPGLLSAGDDPGNGYLGKIGLPGAAETDDPLRTDIGSVYGTASAFLLAPHYTLQFLKNLQTAFPGVLTDAGFTDAIKMREVTRTDPETGEPVTVREPVFSTQYFGVDQASFMLSLLGTSRNYLSNYLTGLNIRDTFDDLYGSIELDLAPVRSGTIEPPDFDTGTAKLYQGTNALPDGAAAGLVKKEAFVPVIFDPEFGEGRVYSYQTASGLFHHLGIEFGEGTGLRKMDFQEYLLLPGRASTGRALAGGFELDLYGRAGSSGAFYSQYYGYASSLLTRDPELGEVRRVTFDFQYPLKPVGLWDSYDNPGLDISQYDFLTIPVRLGENTPERVRLKFEFKGSGNIFVTEPLGPGWQFMTIPVAKPVEGKVTQIATVIQSTDGRPVAGEVFLGPLSGVTMRTSNTLDWSLLLGKSESEIRTLIQGKIATSPAGGGLRTVEEVLEDFTIDSSGQLIDGVLKRADGGIQYFQDGRLVKWVFRNGRTVLYENGLASFAVDLARGKLEIGRFYYDQDLKGEVRSFNIQDNDRKRIFGADGELQTLVQDGLFLDYENGAITSIRTPEATLTDLVFADDGGLLRAHVVRSDGREFDINEQDGQATDMGNGVTIYSRGTVIIAIETAQNGRTDFTYHYDAMDRLVGVDAAFLENGASRTLPLFEYLQRPERLPEKEHLIAEMLSVFSIPGIVVGGFSVGTLPSGEFTSAGGGGSGADYQGYYQFLYKSALTSSPTLGMCLVHRDNPVPISDYGFLSLTIEEDPSMDWDQDFVMKVKGTSYAALYSYAIDDVTPDSKTFWFPMAGKSGNEGEITLELIRQQDGVGKVGLVFIKDLSYMTVKTLDHLIWEEGLGVTAAQLRNLKIESDNLTAVGAAIASREAVRYGELVPWLDTPSRLFYRDLSNEQNHLESFKRFDGTEVELEGQNVSRVILADGTVNTYDASGSQSQGTIRGPEGAGAGTTSYSYGALRKITQADGREFTLSYEFDGDGKEITVFKDVKSGEERRFKDGKLQTATDASGVVTRYAYEDGELIGAELTYKNRVLNSTQYNFQDEETRVTDERGTIWYYDADGRLIKHMTQDGFLYEYSEYTRPLEEGETVDPNDYKSALYTPSGLRAVSLIGYQAPDGSWIRWKGTADSEIHLASGSQAVNVEFDEEQKIRAGQIQFANGMILEIENYIPVRGRFENGQAFEAVMPEEATGYDILQDESGSYLGFSFTVGDRTFSCNIAGELTKAESTDGVTHAFSYVRNNQNDPVSYTDLERRQVAFNGVPFPREVVLTADTDQKLTDSGDEIAVHSGSGFLIGVYKEASNHWDVYSGSFASAAERTGLKHFLSEIKAGDSVAMTVSDGSFSLADEEIFAALEGLGAGGVRQAAAANSRWSFFGNEILNPGQGSENTGAASFSTVTETTTAHSIVNGETPLFGNVPMLFRMPEDAAEAYSGFLRSYQPLQAARDMQALTVYNAENEIVFSRRLDGISSFYQFEKVRETFAENGDLLSVHEYACPAAGCRSPEDMTLRKITLTKARMDFEAEAQQAEEQIEQAKFDALYRLAWQDEVARGQIKENVDAGVAQINSQISGLEAQRFQQVKVCRRVWFWTECDRHTYEVPGVRDAINQLAGQRAELIRTGEEQLAGIPGAVAAKKLEIEQATAAKMLELDEQKESFLLDLLHQEMEPVITDHYRRILGRDASKQEFDSWVDRFKAAGELDIAALRSELAGSSEKMARETQKTAILQGIRDFLEDYLAAPAEVRGSMLQTLRLQSSEAVALEAEDMDAVLEWLESRDLHFGQSAFLSLREMLASEGVEVPMETIGQETVLIDILTGTINKFTDGDLVISMFALDRAAAIHGRDFASVKYTYDDLRNLYRSVCGLQSEVCSLRTIAHIGEDHFVVLERVTETEVTYREMGKGAAGESVTITKEQFLDVWIAKDGSGYLMVTEEQAIQEKKLTDEEAMRVRGAFWFIFFFVASVFLTVTSMIVSVFSPTLGKWLGYAALVAGIVGIVAGLGGFIVEGVKAVFSSIVQNGIFGAIKQGIAYLGQTLWTAVKSVGRFVMKAFEFVKDGFTGGLSGLGAGITQVKDFLITPAQEILRDGVVIGHKFTFAQVAARQLVGAGLNIGVSKGLEGLGIDPQLCQLAGAFVGGGFLGAGSATSSFIRSGLQQLALQGVSQMALNIGLAPPIADALSLITSQSLTAFFDPALTLKAGLLGIAPTVAQQLTMGGLEMLSRSLGLDPRITGLLSLPFAATIGGVVGAAITGDSNLNIWQTIQYSLTDPGFLGGLVSVGANIVMNELGLPSIASELVSGFLSGLGQTDMGKQVFSKISDGLERFTGWIGRVFGPVIDFGTKVLNGAAQATAEGFRSALSAFSSIFSPQTRENIYQDMAGLQGGTVTVDGDTWTWQSGDSRVVYHAGTGVLDESFGVGGTAKIEGLGEDSSGHFAYNKITYSTVTTDGTLTQTYENGAMTEWGLLYPDGTSIVSRASGPDGWGADGNVWNGNVENGEIVYNIPGPDPENPDTGSATYFFNVTNGQIHTAKVEVVPGSGAGNTQSSLTDPLYVLANGIGNDSYSAPDYILNLENDLQAQSQGQIVKDRDTLAVPLYFPWTQNGTLNKGIDIIRVVLESQIPEKLLTHALRVTAHLIESYVSDGDRPVVAMGYSGGFAPLIEGLVSTPYNPNVTGIVGLGAATLSLPKDTIDIVLKIIQKVTNTVIDGLEFLLDKLFIVGQKAAEFINYVQQKAFDQIMKTLQEAVSAIQKIPISPLPNVGAQTNAQFLLNVYGTKDVLAETGIGGYRSELAGFTPAGVRGSNDEITRQLFNVEIVGATHFDYMREAHSSAWNIEVARFVTDLMIASKSKDGLKLFLDSSPYVSPADSRGVRTVKLPGWESHA